VLPCGFGHHQRGDLSNRTASIDKSNEEELDPAQRHPSEGQPNLSTTREGFGAQPSRVDSRHQQIHLTLLRPRGRSRLLSHLARDEAFSGPGIDNAPGIDLLTLSFVAVVDAIPLDDRRVAI
jgi:hypothetical protein